MNELTENQRNLLLGYCDEVAEVKTLITILEMKIANNSIDMARSPNAKDLGKMVRCKFALKKLIDELESI